MLLGASADGDTVFWKRADLYLLDWNVYTGRRVSAEHLRGPASGATSPVFHTITISEPYKVGQIVRMLDLAALYPFEGQPGDARLLIDLFDSSGRRTSFYASKWTLYTLDNRRRHPIDEHFRNYFREITK
jgi:hypothetical protein